MSRLMYDSVTPGDIPVTAQMVAGYVDGAYAWPDSGWRRFPNAVTVGIAVLPTTNDGDVLDVETGDATPADAPAWVKMRLAAGKQAVSVYVNRSNVGAVEAALNAAGLAGKYGVWLADWTGQPHSVPGTYAVQYANPTYSGGHYDLSEVADYWPGVDAPAGLVLVPDWPTALALIAQGVQLYYLDASGNQQPFSPALNLPAGTKLYHQATLPPPAPAPTPTPTPTPAPPLDAARASWARLGDLLITDFPGTVERVAAAVAKINGLP